MDVGDPFHFCWGVDQTGYEVRTGVPGLILSEVSEFVVAHGGPERRYQPLEHPALWRTFCETCQDRDGALTFAGKFGLLREPNQLAYGAFGRLPPEPGDRLADTLELANHIRAIARLLDLGLRREAMNRFNNDRPKMSEYILWEQEQPERFRYKWVPLSLRDALLHQIGEAITRNHQFRQCANSGCSNWFQLGPHQAQGGRRQTTTVRRRFCSDYCRVASARRQKREATHA
jgi:hypothetical protein